MCSNRRVRWSAQQIRGDRPEGLPGLPGLDELVRSVATPEFAGVTFHEVLAKSALNHVPPSSRPMADAWTINPYRGCQHACVYCFARTTHTYLDLDAGKDFDSQIIVKINVAEIVAAELRRMGDRVPSVNLGTNTDPYQRAEGRYQLLPPIIRALAARQKPISILTKGTLLRRDLPLLAEVNQQVPVRLAMSIAIFDDELQHSVEPGTPSTAARLATVKAAGDHGLPCGVLMMPILPYLTDSTEHLDHALSRLADAGAEWVQCSALYLRPGVKEWFMAWLGRTHPELVGRYTELYAKGSYAPKAYRTWLTERVRPLIRAYRLSPGPGRRAEPARRTEPKPLLSPAAPQQTLF
jgi:DNA repair photolyase